MNYKILIQTVCICSLLAAGCSGKTASQETETPHPPAAEDIVITANGTPDYRYHFESMEDCLEVSEAVIYGEVTDYQMYAEEGNGSAFTLETIHITETLYCDAEPGTDIVLLLTGGYVTLSDYINAHKTAEERQAYRESEGFAELSDEELKTKYIAMVPEGYYYPEIGDRGVYCLIPVPEIDADVPWKEKDHVYWAAGGWQGIYREKSGVDFVKPNNSSSMTDPDRTYPGDIITYDELKAEIQKAAGQIGS